jgi:hypothetical protein
MGPNSYSEISVTTFDHKEHTLMVRNPHKNMWTAFATSGDHSIKVQGSSMQGVIDKWKRHYADAVDQ